LANSISGSSTSFSFKTITLPLEYF
jgi:hypothetical protein